MTAPEISQLSVLVVDESQEMRRKLAAFLSEFSQLHVVGMAENAATALDLFFHYRPDVVLVSICLPDRNGFDVLHCVKQAEPNCAVIMMTKQANPSVEQSGLLLGATAVCAKSGDLLEMREAVVRLLEERSSGQQ